MTETRSGNEGHKRKYYEIDYTWAVVLFQCLSRRISKEKYRNNRTNNKEKSKTLK